VNFFVGAGDADDRAKLSIKKYSFNIFSYHTVTLFGSPHCLCFCFRLACSFLFPYLYDLYLGLVKEFAILARDEYQHWHPKTLQIL